MQGVRAFFYFFVLFLLWKFCNFVFIGFGLFAFLFLSSIGRMPGVTRGKTGWAYIWLERTAQFDD
jgi:hypothetical protein